MYDYEHITYFMIQICIIICFAHHAVHGYTIMAISSWICPAKNHTSPTTWCADPYVPTFISYFPHYLVCISLCPHIHMGGQYSVWFWQIGCAKHGHPPACPDITWNHALSKTIRPLIHFYHKNPKLWAFHFEFSGIWVIKEGCNLDGNHLIAWYFTMYVCFMLA